MTLTAEQLEEYRRSPIWRAALQHVKDHVTALDAPTDIDTYAPYSSGWCRAQHDVSEFLDDELDSVQIYVPPPTNVSGDFYES